MPGMLVWRRSSTLRVMPTGVSAVARPSDSCRLADGLLRGRADRGLTAVLRRPAPVLLPRATNRSALSSQWSPPVESVALHSLQRCKSCLPRFPARSALPLRTHTGSDEYEAAA